jgi:hypothetical protein
VKVNKHTCKFVPLFVESFNPGRAWWYYRLGYSAYVVCPACKTIAKIINSEDNYIYQVITNNQLIRNISDQACAWNSYTVHQEYRKASMPISKDKASR